MKNKDEIVQRLKGCYVGKDKVQLMFKQVGDCMTILDVSGILYHKKAGSNFFVDKSNTADRRRIFPYYNISSYNGRNCVYVNQLLDFDRIYIKIADNRIEEYYVVKDGQEALVAVKILQPADKNTKICTKDEVDKMFRKSENSIYGLDGSKVNFDGTVIDENLVLDTHKEWIKKNIELELYTLKNFDRPFSYVTNKFGKIEHSEEKIEMLRKFCEKSLDRLTIDDVDEKYNIVTDYIFIYEGMNDIDSIKGVSVIFIGHDRYEVIETNYPLTKYSYAHLKQLETTNSAKYEDPKINRFLNPNIDMEEVEKSKQWVKKYKR